MKKTVTTIVALLLVFLTIFSVVQLFRLRFEAGDIYPAYSSLRADPLGTRVLFDALQQIPTLRVERLTSPNPELPQGTNQTLLILNWPHRTESPRETARQMKAFAATGNRLVIALREIDAAPRKSSRNSDEEPDEAEESDDEAELDDTGTLPELLGFETDWIDDSTEAEEAVPVISDLRNPLPWKSKLALEPGPGWEPVLDVGGHPVAIERSFNGGSMVVMTESYPFSNEAMLKQRDPELLSWLLGNSKTIYFEETHFGIVKRPGMGTLIRKYGLTPAFILLGLVGILFVWRNALPLVPRKPNRREGSGPAVLGKNTAEARINLLRRAIPRANLIESCMHQWRDHCRQTRERHPAMTAEAERLAAEEAIRPTWKRRPLETYRSISEILTKHEP